jgi:hypothetical protein
VLLKKEAEIIPSEPGRVMPPREVEKLFPTQKRMK